MTASLTETAQPPVLYTIQQVAELLHLHPQTVRLLHRNGELGYVKSGNRHLTSADQLQTFIDANRSD